jgi:hypothetical protein
VSERDGEFIHKNVLLIVVKTGATRRESIKLIVIFASVEHCVIEDSLVVCLEALATRYPYPVPDIPLHEEENIKKIMNESRRARLLNATTGVILGDENLKILFI